MSELSIDSDLDSKVGSDLDSEVDSEVRRRVGTAWREIRRGASAFKVRDLFYSDGDDHLDQALADALGVISNRGPIRMGELADALRVTPASTTRAVSCLADKGYVRRVRGRQDQRSVMVETTKAGRLRFDVISGRIQNGLDRILSEFSAAEQEQLADYLERFVSAVDRLVDNETRTPDP